MALCLVSHDGSGSSKSTALTLQASMALALGGKHGSGSGSMGHPAVLSLLSLLNCGLTNARF